MAFQKTLVILKPDAVGRALTGRIISRIEDKGLFIIGMKMMKVSKALARKHYAEHKGKPFYEGLVRFITSGPVVVLVVEGKAAIQLCRRMMGATFGSQAEPGTIRGDFGVSDTYNLIHGSDSPESAKREIALYFKKSEIVHHCKLDMEWLYNCSGKEPV